MPFDSTKTLKHSIYFSKWEAERPSWMGGPVGILTGTEQSGKAGDATETSRSLFNGGRGGGMPA